MARKNFPADLVEQASSMEDAWARIDPNLVFGKLNLVALHTDISNLSQVEADLRSLENQLTDLRVTREALQQSTWDKMKRIRSSMKGIYGDDSKQYEMMGGKRASDKKPGRRTPPVPVVM